MSLPSPPLVTLSLTVSLVVACAGGPAYDEAALADFRADWATTLQADNGWLTVAGLHFLREGEQTFGSAADNDLVLDYAGIPEHGGTVTMTGTDVIIRALDGETLDLNGAPASEGPLRLAEAGRPADLVSYGNVTFFLHYSGPRLALRVRDQNAALRREFHGLQWFDADPTYRVTGRFTPAAADRVVQIQNILGDFEPFTVAGTVTFDLGGQTHGMEAWRSRGGLWFVFRDRTSEDLSYPAARFLYTPGPGADGTVVMDFNYAQNPPCAYNEWTTCPLPPDDNRLRIRVEAGELRYHPEA